jgi:hypothetical protein
VPTETAAGIASGTSFTLFDLGSRVGKTGAQLETESDAGGVTEWLRPEDGSWDPTDPNTFYFVTTNSFAAPSRLWRLTFNDVTIRSRASSSKVGSSSRCTSRPGRRSRGSGAGGCSVAGA